MQSRHRAATLVVIVIVAATTLAASQIRKEYRYTVGSRGSVSITNQYGPIAVKAVSGNQITVTAILRSEKVEIDQTQSGRRVEIVSHLLAGANSDSGRVEYQLSVPFDCSVNMHSTTGPLHAEGLHGNLSMEGPAANMDAHDLQDGDVDVKTLNGTVSLANIRADDMHVSSLSGDVTLSVVDGEHVVVNTGSGHIRYDGDFGAGGQYRLTSHTGDIDATAPTYASIAVIARSERGGVENDFILQPQHTPFPFRDGRTFAGTMGQAASSVKLFSFSGKIHLKKR